MTPPLELSRSQILRFRRRVSFLDERLPAGAKSLCRAAWAGLQDSVPRGALLSLHARVKGVDSSNWEHPSLVQLWGPRFSVYVVAGDDLPIFSLGRLPQNNKRRQRAEKTAERLHVTLKGTKLPFGQAGRAMRVPPNSLRYAAATGTLLMRWDGARQPVVWTVPPPTMDPEQARLELACRYLHVFGPATAMSFSKWAGISLPEARAAFNALARTLTPARTPIGDAWILGSDEATFTSEPVADAPARFLPSGDTYYLLWGVDRELLVPNATRRAQLWTTRVWPGAVLVDGEISGIWRRSAAEISIDSWRRFSSKEREAIEKEALSLPLPGIDGSIKIRWT